MTVLSAAILLFLVMDPLGNILLFVTALKTVPAARRRRVVARELLIAYAVLVVFLFTGEHLLHCAEHLRAGAHHRRRASCCS